MNGNSSCLEHPPNFAKRHLIILYVLEYLVAYHHVELGVVERNSIFTQIDGSENPPTYEFLGRGVQAACSVASKDMQASRSFLSDDRAATASKIQYFGALRLYRMPNRSCDAYKSVDM